MPDDQTLATGWATSGGSHGHGPIILGGRRVAADPATRGTVGHGRIILRYGSAPAPPAQRGAVGHGRISFVERPALELAALSADASTTARAEISAALDAAVLG